MTSLNVQLSPFIALFGLISNFSAFGTLLAKECYSVDVKDFFHLGDYLVFFFFSWIWIREYGICLCYCYAISSIQSFVRFSFNFETLKKENVLKNNSIMLCTIFLFVFLGEGFHNYHHTFPFDYATSEFGCKINITTAFINLMCFLGLARDRKSVSRDMIAARIQRTGDGSYKSG